MHPPRASASLLVGSLALVSCSRVADAPPPRWLGAGSASPHRGGTLRFAIVDDVRTLDPAIAYDEYTLYAEHLLFDTLVGYGRATSADPLKLVPQLAESWSLSPDGRTYRFTLRPGLVFADGEPLVAPDFAYTFDRLLSPEVPSPGAQFYTGIAGAADRIAGKADRVRGVRAPDDLHLEIELDRADASFPLLLAMPFVTPLKKSRVEALGPRIRDTPLASGPFVLGEWREGEVMRFERNPRYWDAERTYLDGIEMRLLVPQETAVLQFLGGELDTVERISADDYLRFARSPDWQPYLYKLPLLNVYGELMNVRMKPFDDKRVRQAMNYAVNKEDSVKIYNGRAVVSHGILPPLMPGYDPEMKPYPHDPAKARALLAEAGYPDGFEVTYTTLKEELGQRVAQSIQADLAEVGVRVNIELVTFPAYLSASGRRELPFAYTAWLMDFPDPWDFLEVKFHSRMIADENANNDTGYSNPEVDALLDQARVELDPARRLALYHRVEEILHDDCPWIFDFHRMLVEVRQPWLMDYAPHPVWIRDYRGVWLDEPRRKAER